MVQRLHKTGNKNARSLNAMPTRLHRIINQSDADIVNLHWINNEMISIREIGKIKKPIVWTLHDMWPICGAAHNVLDEYRDRFKNGYQSARPKGDRGVDLERWTWRRKQKHWKGLNPIFVGVSSWMVDNVRQSTLFPDAQAVVIPNVVDTNCFKPIDKQVARRIFDLPVDKKIILFTCSDAPYKGMDLMAQALRKYAEAAGEDSFMAVAFGDSSGVEEHFQDLPTRFVGRLNDEYSVSALYAAADVTCVPSQIESFGQTASESLACGIPVVSFDCTGLTDIVDHKVNGYAARPFDTDDFEKGIEWVLDQRAEDRGQRSEVGLSGVALAKREGQRSAVNDLKTEAGQADSGDGIEAGSTYETLCRNARDKAERCFSEGVVAAKYLELYTQVLRIR